MIFDLSKQLFNELSEFISERESPSESQLKALIESTVRKCNLVSREEFDAQTAVLARTRTKLESLEKQLQELESTLENDR